MSLQFTRTDRNKRTSSQLPDRIQLDPRVASMSFALAVAEVLNRVERDDSSLSARNTNRP
jgi:hypothetical protein